VASPLPASFLDLWARLQEQQCQLPACMCPQALLFVWPVGRTREYELRTRDGKRFEGSAGDDQEAVRFAGVTLVDQGLRRMRVVFARPQEVPRA
jgi:hypothetical protein